MRSNDLPNLRGLIVNASHLKIAVIKALNHAMVRSKRGLGYSDAAEALYDFLVAAIDAVRTYTRAASISVLPATVTLDISALETSQLATTATYADAETEDVSADLRVTYVSSDPTKATVSVTGLITPLVAGSTTVTTTYHGRTDTTVVTVQA